jgi:acyl transferase domain-containing protein/thioesterase domain-containing protein/ubiquinone/menaquinone biosynthesis C-methylase UbiE/acyl carrier protein
MSELFEGSEIAIIGMSARFPGAKNIEAFWQNIRDGVESISFFSDEELIASGVEPALLNNPNYVKANTMLADIEGFDALFFDISAREAEIMDPQHRLFLMHAWEALENAGYDPATYEGLIGVYAGLEMSSYLLNNLYPNRERLESVSNIQLIIGNDKDYLPTHVSYKLNLKGPSVNVQTACSTSLVAAHLACQSLQAGDCDMALVGGASVSESQQVGYLYQEGMIRSPDGHCRAFDAKAQGTMSGKGVGIVVLRRLVDALTDGDCIHAIIKGSAINNDGSLKVGYTAPSIEGQKAVILDAQAIADIEPETITYVETHGTGTKLGDPIEIAALTKAFQKSTQKKGFCAIGSVKTNIGHAGAAAGIAGLIKTVFALKHQLLPPSLHFEQPNPQIDFANSPFYVNTKLSEWKTDGIPRYAGVSSFGIGGTNAHVILEEAPIQESLEESRPWQLVVISAKTPSALDTASLNLATHLEQHPDINLADVAYTLSKGRHAFSQRRMLVCQDINEAITALHTHNPKHVFTHSQASEKQTVVFMFSGQGAQYVNMALELYQNEPIFREQVDLCSEYLMPHLGLDLRQVLYPSEERNSEAIQLNQTAITQVALFVIEYALVQLWMSWGVYPDAMIGHSIGEYVAAHFAGVFSLEDALLLVAKRGQMMQQLHRGTMLAVSLSEKEVLPLLGKGLSLAAINSPSRCVVSGITEAVEALQNQLTDQGVECRRLHTSHAFHSEMMNPILNSFMEWVKQVKLNHPKIPYVSNLTGIWITAAEATDPNYWAKHLRQTVRFSEGLQHILENSEQILLEIGPGRMLSTLAQQHPNKAADQVILSSLRHPQYQLSDIAFLLNTLGKLWLAGGRVSWSGFYTNERRHRLPLPTYPFECQRYWIDPPQPADRHVQQVATAQNMWQSVIEATQKQADISLSALDNFISDYPIKQQCLDDLCLAYMNLGIKGLGAFKHSDEKYSLGKFAQQFRIDPRYQQLVSRWLNVLVEKGQLQQKEETISQLRPLTTETVNMLLKQAKRQWASDPQWRSIQRFGENMVTILRGEKEPRELFFPDTSSEATDVKNTVQEKSPLFSHYNSIMRACLEQMVKLLPTNVNLRILEIGGGRGVTTKVVLPVLPVSQTRYTFTDITQFFLNQAQQQFSTYPFVQYRLLNLDKSPQEQGYDKHSFDVVIATLVLHVTQKIEKTLQHLRFLLAPGGLFLIWEITQPQLKFDIVEGFFMEPLDDGKRNQGNPFLSKEQWHEMLRKHGFVAVETFPNTDILGHLMFIAQAEPSVPAFTHLLEATDVLDTQISFQKHVRPEIAQDYIAPRNEAEQTIAKFWQDMLSIEKVGIHDDFFELGGDSLIAVPLLIKLRDTFQKSLSPQVLVQAPTIAQLTELIIEVQPTQSQQAISSPLLTIQATGTKPPFFCVHPAGGNVLCYTQLAHHLGSEQPFYGLQAKGLDGKDEPFTQIEDMAAYYIKALRVVQSQGPYFLGGWSFGGLVAFEMAQQLRTQGDQVALLAIIDIGAPSGGTQRDNLEDAVLLAWFAVDLGISAKPELTLLIDTLQGLAPEARWHYLLTQAKKINVLPATAEVNDIRPLAQVFKSNLQAMQNYVPQFYSNRITLFRASELAFFQDNEFFNGSLTDPVKPAMGWDKLSSEPIEVYTIPGNHHTIIAEPHVEQLAEQLRRCIDIQCEIVN